MSRLETLPPSPRLLRRAKSAKRTSTKTESTDVAAQTSGTKSGMSRWSTNPSVSSAVTLNDQTLRATKTIKDLAHPVVDFSGKKGMTAFGKGSYAYKGSALGGVSIYALGPSSQPIDNAKGFAFNKGGKLPGLYRGTSDDGATGCSGGRTRATCWSLRYMWRTAGDGELYAYLPSDAESTNKANPNKTCDLGYGWSLGRGTWKWTPGTWQTIAQKITLNDVDKAHGPVETYLDSKNVHTINNVIIRTHKNAMPRSAMIQSFFGGSDGSWASPKDQQVYFANFSLAVLETE
ncbi:hypothetical protein FRC10_010990 [Ceratobasidium sp. 414]|nr:hypothetical protein FRC10_010990 [Ceratobasidium sp. 414]